MLSEKEIEILEELGINPNEEMTADEVDRDFDWED